MIYLGIPNDRELLAGVGEVSLRHGQLDYVLRMTVKSLEGLTIQEALDATERQGSTELRVRVRKLAKQRFGEGAALVRLDALLTRCGRATKRRNELIHNLWAHKLDGEPVIRDDTHEFRPVPTLAELQGLSGELAALASELNFARLDGFLKEAMG